MIQLALAILAATPLTLPTVIKQAHGGDTVALSGDFGAGSFNRLHFDPPLTITGAAAGGFMPTIASFTGLTVVQSSGLRFVGLVIASGPLSSSNAQAIRVVASQGIAFDGLTLTGGYATNGVPETALAADATGNVIGRPAGKGINLANCDGCAVTGSDISLFAKGITLSGGRGIVIADNRIHDLRTTPISGMVTADMTITGNHTWDSFPWRFGYADHGDRIHIWTAGAAIPGLVIARNVLAQGNGAPMLGIYLDDNRQSLGFPGAIIEGNDQTDANGQGIRVEYMRGGRITGNTLRWTGKGREWNDAPRILPTTGTRDVAITGNRGVGFTRPLVTPYRLTADERASLTISDNRP